MSCKFGLRNVLLIGLLGLFTLRLNEKAVAISFADENWQASLSHTQNLIIIPQDGNSVTLDDICDVSSAYCDALAYQFTNMALAAVGAGYDISWWTVDGGGGSSSGGGYSLSGTVGQPDAASSSGGGYTLAGGFWSGVPSAQTQSVVYLPLVVR
ncbi:MAG: hypothetical protein ACOY16_09250 [Chloroflexota bacterium]